MEQITEFSSIPAVHLNFVEFSDRVLHGALISFFQHYWRSVFSSLNSYIMSSTNTISLSSCFVRWDLWVSEFFKMTVSADKVCLAHFQLISSSIKTSFSNNVSSYLFLSLQHLDAHNRVTLGYAGITMMMHRAHIWTVACLGLKPNGNKSYWVKSTPIFNEGQQLVRKKQQDWINKYMNEYL